MTNPNDPINSVPDLNDHPSSWYGLTKREYFAAMAMQGILANASNAIRNSEFVSGLSVEYADALINALNR